MVGLEHENIVRQFNVGQNATWRIKGEEKNVNYIVQEYVERGELLDYVAKEGGGPMNDKITRYYAR